MADEDDAPAEPVEDEPKPSKAIFPKRAEKVVQNNLALGSKKKTQKRALGNLFSLSFFG